MLEKQLKFISEKDQKGPTIDLFFHELDQKETRPKRIFEKTVALFGLLLFIVTLPVISLLILLTIGWPIFVKNDFYGYRGNRLERYLYRIHKTDEATVKTGIGRFLYKTGLYKLPNCVNILRGEMSLVGPNPLPLDDSEVLNKKFTDFYKRFSTHPGVVGVQNGDSWELNQNTEQLAQSLKKELRYVLNPSLKNDIKVLKGVFQQ
ncbi:MAG: sugar transferase [Balneolaceae bacterium]|nr:sugar transferase [Balneolaceae bacterium]